MTTRINVPDHAVTSFPQECSQKHTAPAGRTLGVWAIFCNAIRRRLERDRNKRSLRHLSDHSLRDIGFEPGFLDMQIDARLRAEEAERAHHRSTLRNNPILTASW